MISLYQFCLGFYSIMTLISWTTQQIEQTKNEDLTQELDLPQKLKHPPEFDFHEHFGDSETGPIELAVSLATLKADETLYEKICSLNCIQGAQSKSLGISGSHPIYQANFKLYALKCQFTLANDLKLRVYLIPYNGTYYALYPTKKDLSEEQQKTEELMYIYE